ncbi:hypothetical protein BAE44_0007176 [Dichanthelium oligosanthes]|uniref:Uncharacterized protein n=1 Tax=Dichanthelium oligosanthes TaxID=888268 RepID=A0A1E5W324_9POAL|nr:hypothetical protein BAE44_0007176 [Dichanthelium oligosanthes]
MGSAVSSSMALALAGFCFSVIFIVFVCSRLACALLRRRRTARSRRAPPLPQFAVSHYTFTVQAARHSTGAGLDPAKVAAFPTRAFAAGGAGPRGSGASDSSDDADSQ